MIYFVIPLRSKAASRSWDSVQESFNRTLWSCYNQTSPQFKVVVVCHDIPRLDKNYDERVQFVPVSIPTPTNPEEMMFDKGYKLYTGMKRVGEELRNVNGGGYVLPLDADDLVSCNLVAFFENRDDKLCYKSQYGWIWQQGSRWVMKAKDLYRTCGSCTILYYEPDELPSVPFEEKDNKHPFLFQCSHRFLPANAIKHGKQFAYVPFSTTVYVLGTGENHSLLKGIGISWKRQLEGFLRLPRYIGKEMKKEFNLG